MKRSAIVLCLPAVLLAASSALSQQTEVRVLKGKVKAETDGKTVLVDTGQKAVLAAGKPPVVGIDEQIVRDLVELNAWIDAEKQADRMRIDYSGAKIHSLESDTLLRAANLTTLPNKDDKPTTRLRIGPTSTPINPQFYDMTGRPIPTDTEKVTDSTVYCYLNLPQPVPPKGKFQFIFLGELAPTPQILWRDGPLWYLQISNDTPYCLNYFRLILPKSAILLDSTLPPTIIDSVDGRVAVTFRNYTGPFADGHYTVAFLWPAKDGSSLQDAPLSYRGLPDPRIEQLSSEFRQGLERIHAGHLYDDLTTPVRSLLTWYCGILRQDKDLLSRCMDRNNASDPQTWLKGITPDYWKQLQHDTEQEVFLGTTLWPDQPEEGYKHPVFMARPASRIRVDTMYFAWHAGKWYRNSNAGNPWDDGTWFTRLAESQQKK